MALIQSTAIPSSGGYEIDQSLRFNDDDSAYLSKTFASAGNRKTWTWSAWVKRGNLVGSGTRQSLFSNTGSSHTTFGDIRIDPGDDLHVGTYTTQLALTSALLRDPSAWYHIIVVMDTTQGTVSNRLKIYINGVEQSLAVDNRSSLSQNTDYGINSASEHAIGRMEQDNNWYLDGYLGEVNFIDGTAKAPADFGETGDYGEWKPIEYSGSYGTNGFYLPFKQDYTVEGFSTVTYKGNGGTQYIGGTSFQPDLTWLKERSSTSSHGLFDAVRGVTTVLRSDNTGADETQANYLNAFNTDGFTVGDDGSVNQSGETYVGWNWDMDAGTRKKLPISVNGTIKHVTAQSKVPSSSSSIYAPSGNANYLQIGEDGDIDLGGDNFTIEFWVKAGSGNFFSGYSGGHNVYFSKTGTSTGDIYIATSAAANPAQITSITWANWNHIALVRVNNVFTAYVNGSSQGTATLSGTLSSTAFRIGRNGTDSADGSGYFDEIRISNTARYTGNFTTTTTAFTEDANTLALIHSLARDDSTSIVDGGAIKVNGSINSIVMANPSYGQSIVSYTGIGDADQAYTIGHGLSSAPEMIIVKARTEAGKSWQVYHEGVDASSPQNYRLKLNATDARETQSTGNSWQNTAPTNSVFTVGNGSWVNENTKAFIAYCFHSVTGYSKFGSYQANDNTTGPTITTDFKPAFVMIKCTSDGGSDRDWTMFDNTRSPTNTINLNLKANESSAENANSRVPLIDFNDTNFQLRSSHGETNGGSETYIYMAFADKREYAYWLDQSGNNNDWTSNNLTESDISVDSPTNNFATMNPISTIGTYSEGNLEVLTTVSGSVPYNQMHYGTFAMTSGKWYFECLVKDISGLLAIGISSTESINRNRHNNLGSNGVNSYLEDGRVYTEDTEETAPDTYGVGDIISVAYDMDANKIYFAKNNAWQSNGTGAGNPATAANPYTIDTLAGCGQAPIITNDNTSNEVSGIFNFGQDSSFAGTKTSQGNQDGNDIGDFYYTPPTGFLSLCTKNLPDVAVTPSEHFNTVLYTGDGTSGRDIVSGVDADMVWIKSRNHTYSNEIFDSVRGVTKRLMTNSTDAESTKSGVTAFNTNGFELGSNSSENADTKTYVAWNWKANGSGSSNTNGSITSTVSANVDAGFSIVSYTGTGSATTVGHGLSKAPEAVITKSRNATQYWIVQHTDLTSVGRNLYLQRTDPQQADNQYTGISSTTLTVSGGSVNANNTTYISYCFHSVDGYSAVGSYVGNGNADGTFVYTGFRPAYVMIKSRDGAENWVLYDNLRAGYNPDNNYVLPNTSATEYTGYKTIDLTSNGFKLRTTHSDKNATGTYIYIAFAESPFKYSNAR